MTRTIFHIRHGQTDWNLAGRLQGSQDIPLNATGRAQADANGVALARAFATEGLDPAGFAFVASPLGRTRETMRRVRAGLGLDPEAFEVVHDLREVSFGAYEGKTYDDIAREAPADYDEIVRDKWRFLPPEGESYVMLADRLAGWLATTTGDLVIVSHGGCFRALRSVIEGLDDPELAHLLVPQDRIFVWRDRHGSWL
ncbi:MAG: histidine phosphatase family protein [Hyphomicrobiales bacterium]|nr:histidine phosphatase family protein [Hyphomicrobiales bacterium]